MGGNLRIGATWDGAELKAGMADSEEAIRASARNIGAAFEEVHGRTKAAWKGLGDDVKAGAEQVTKAQLDVAAATKAQAAALADLSRVRTLMKSDNISEAQGLALLASAQQKVAMTSAELAAAKEAEAAKVNAANEEEELSENAVVAAFQRANRSIGESLAGLQERLYITGETAHLSAREIAGSFSGLGELLGIGLLAGMGGEYLDDLAKLNIELDHLSTETGINITSLAGLQVVVKSMGAEWEPIQRGIQRLGKALQEGRFGQVEYNRALQAIGVSLQELNGKNAEEQLGIIAEGFRRTTDQTKLSYAATELFSRGGIALIPVLREYGAGITQVMDQQGKLTGVTDESAAAARRWQADMTRLTVQFRSVMMPVMEHVEDVIRGIVGVFDAAANVIVDVFEAIATAIVAVIRPLGAVAKELYHLVTGNFRAMMEDARRGSQQFSQVWKDGFEDIKRNWAVVVHDFTYQTPAPNLPEFAPSDLTPVPKTGRTRTGKTAKEKLPRIAPEDDLGVVLAPDMSRAAAEMIENLREQGRTATQVAHQETEAYRASLDEQMRMAEETLGDKRQDLEAELAAHKITLAQKIKVEVAAVEQTRKLYQQLMQAKQVLDMGDAAAYQRDLNQQAEAMRRFDRQIVQITRQNSEEMKKSWRQGVEDMTANFNGAVAQWTVTGRGFGQSMAQIMAGISSNFIQNSIKMVEQEIAAAVTHKALQKQEILGDAKTAAAHAFTSVLKSLPFPANVILAPPAAAASFAAVMAFQSFDQGGVVGARMGYGGMGAHVPILAEQGERVLTPAQNHNFETLVNNSRSSQTSTSNVNFGDITQNFHGAKASPKQMKNSIEDLMRRGKLRTA